MMKKFGKTNVIAFLAVMSFGLLASCSQGNDNNPDTVSYTHLDVYKRQVIDIQDAAPIDRLQLARLSLMTEDIVVEQCGDEVVGRRDSMEVTREEHRVSLFFIGVDATFGSQPKACLLYTSRCV